MSNSSATVTPFDLEDFTSLGLVDLFKAVRWLMSQRQALDYRLLSLLRELDRREHLDGRSLHLASWLSRTFGLGYGAAREKVRTARALGHLPLIDTAFREGRLSYSKVRALTRVVRSDNEEQLLDRALRTSADGVEHLVRRLKQQERIDDVQELIRQRSLTCAWDDDGCLVVNARLTPEQGAIWMKALEKAEAGFDPEDAFEARQADAMTRALEASLKDGAGSGRAPDHYQVVVHVSAETLCSENVPAETLCSKNASVEASGSIERGPALHPETIRRLTCDGALISMLENAEGEILNVGRKTRVIPRAVQRALQARDTRCQFPGCHHTRYLQAHHLTHWSQGGETKLSNLVMICARHHREVHEFGTAFTSQSVASSSSRRETTDPG